MFLIAVDMTPLLPGGENGGAKILVVELLKSFHNIDSIYTFLLLTAEWNHDELAYLESQNMKRLCVLTKKKPEQETKPFFQRIPGRLGRLLHRLYLFTKRKMQSSVLQSDLLRSRNINLLFCPFTAPNYAEPGVPVISLIYDLQHRDYPQF